MTELDHEKPFPNHKSTVEHIRKIRRSVHRSWSPQLENGVNKDDNYPTQTNRSFQRWLFHGSSSTYCIPISLKLCLLIRSRASVPQAMHVMAVKIEATKAVQGMKGEHRVCSSVDSMRPKQSLTSVSVAWLATFLSNSSPPREFCESVPASAGAPAPG